MAGVYGGLGVSETDLPRLIGLRWAGRVFGTNTGNVYLELAGQSPNFTGVLRLLDDRHGVHVFDVSANESAGTLELDGFSRSIDGKPVERVHAKGELKNTGNVEGTWSTDSGTGGTFIFYAHGPQLEEPGRIDDQAQQLFTKRTRFGPIDINKDQILRLGQSILKDFPTSRMIVTVTLDTEQVTYLENFRDIEFEHKHASIIKLLVQTPEAGGLNRVLSLEFGPYENSAYVQSGDESWAMGRIERLRREVKPYERNYFIGSSLFGIRLRDLLILVMLVFLPEVNPWLNRFFYVLLFVGALLVLDATHSRLVPNASIDLRPDYQYWYSRLALRMQSWIGGVLVIIFNLTLTIYFTKLVETWGP